MAFTRPTINEIYSRIKADLESRVTSDVNIPRFSILGILALVFAGAVHLLYGFLVNVADQLFPDTASSWFLDRIANLYGLPRKTATFAVGEVVFTGADTTVIPLGTELQSADGLIYLTTAEVTITGGLITAEIQAEEAGSSSNTLNTAFTLVAPIANVDTEITATTAPEGGIDTETDAELRERLVQRIQNPPSSGTEADYIRWALEVAGVGKAWALGADDYAGAGTVAVVIANSDLSVVSGTVKTATQSYVDTVRPIGAQADVLDIIPLPTIYSIQLEPNTAEVQAAVIQSLQELHLAEAAPGGTILLSHIRSAVSKSGAVDYNITDINVNGSSIGVVDIETTGQQTAAYTSLTPAGF